MSASWKKWTPAVVAVVVVAGVAIAVPAAADSSVKLPAKTAAQVLKLVQSSKVSAFSGDVAETSDLGLPSLPASAGGSSSGSDSGIAGDLALLTGTNSLRVYVDGATSIRVQSLESLGERDVIRHGSDVWTYDSKTNKVEHATLPTPAAGSASGHPGTHWPRTGVTSNDKSSTSVTSGNGTSGTGTSGTPSAAATPGTTTPASLAKSILAEFSSTSSLKVLDDNPKIANRSVYQLVLTPTVKDTLIGSISIAVDSATGLPVQVTIDAAGQAKPAVSIGFTSLSLATPAASLFEFTAPKGATVKQIATPKPGATHATPQADGSATKPTTSVTGSGWDSVITVAASGSSAGSLGKLSTSPEFSELTTAVAGGRVLHTSLFNILFTSDGRFVAGAVSISRLEAVAAQ